LKTTNEQNTNKNDEQFIDIDSKKCEQHWQNQKNADFRNLISLNTFQRYSDGTELSLKTEHTWIPSKMFFLFGAIKTIGK
jgi:hypothetical protein